MLKNVHDIMVTRLSINSIIITSNGRSGGTFLINRMTKKNYSSNDVSWSAARILKIISLVYHGGHVKGLFCDWTFDRTQPPSVWPQSQSHSWLFFFFTMMWRVKTNHLHSRIIIEISWIDEFISTAVYISNSLYKSFQNNC